MVIPPKIAHMAQSGLSMPFRLYSVEPSPEPPLQILAGAIHRWWDGRQQLIVVNDPTTTALGLSSIFPELGIAPYAEATIGYFLFKKIMVLTATWEDLRQITPFSQVGHLHLLSEINAALFERQMTAMLRLKDDILQNPEQHPPSWRFAHVFVYPFLTKNE